MATSLRLFGDRDRASAYWGEARRLMWILKQRLDLSEIPQGQMIRNYPDGTVILVKKVYDVELAEINSPFITQKKEERVVYGGDVLIFYTKDGSDRLAIANTAILDMGSSAGDVSCQTFADTKFDMYPGSSMMPIIAKRFTDYVGPAGAGSENKSPIWFIRMPFAFSGDPAIGHYFFEGFTSDSPIDYLYVEKTAKFYRLQTGAIDEPFNVGTYIYTYVSEYMQAFSFNFDTEVVTTEISEYFGEIVNFIDTEGNYYYMDIVGSVEDYLWASASIYKYGGDYYDMHADSTGATPWYLTLESNFNLSEIHKVNIATLVDTIENAQDISFNSISPSLVCLASNNGVPAGTPHSTYVPALDTDSGIAILTDLSYTYFFGCYAALSGESFSLYNLERKSTIAYGEMAVNVAENIATWPVDPLYEIWDVNFKAQASGMALSEVIECMGKTYTSAITTSQSKDYHLMDFIGTGQFPFYEYGDTDASIDRHEVVTPTALPWPYGTVPFYTIDITRGQYSHVLDQRGDHTGMAGVLPTGWVDTSTNVVNTIAVTSTKTFITPYEEFTITATDVISSWLHLQGKGVLVQAVQGKTLGGDPAGPGYLIYSNGQKIIGKIATKLEVEESAINGMIYLPNVCGLDPQYKIKAALP